MVNRIIPALILVAYFVLAIVYSAATPMFEAPDENYHFAFIQHLTQSFDLPVQNPAVETPWYQEGSQPPLYYMLGAVIASTVRVPDAVYPLDKNPHAEIGVGLARINHNFFLHTSAESFPWNGVTLQFHLVRLLSIALGGLTVFAVYRAARLALPDSPGLALMAMAFVAFNPMFLFVSGSINNDTLVTALSAAGMWMIMDVIRSGFRIGQVVALAVIMALASLSKVSGLTVYPVAVTALACLAWKRRITLRQTISAIIIFAVGLIGIAGWWYIRNLQFYGDLTGLSAMIAIIKPRPTPYTVYTLLTEMQGLRISFWALFGWFNVIGPQWFLALMDVLTTLAVIGGMGGIVWLVRRVRAGQIVESLLPIGILGLQFLVTFASLIGWTRLTPGTQGRLLFPALPAIAVLSMVGWSVLLNSAPRLFNTNTGRFTNRPYRLIGYVLLLSPMVIVAVSSPFLTIAPAYAPPPVVARLPDDAIAANIRFGTITLLGFHIDPEPIYPGGALPVTLYYQGNPDPRNLSLFLTALNVVNHPIGTLNSYPGGGNLPTSQLEPGKIYADRYLLPILPTDDAPMQGQILFDFWNFKSGVDTQPLDINGMPLDRSLGGIILHGGTIISPFSLPPPAVAQSALFSGAIRFKGYTLTPADGVVASGNVLYINLYWEAETRVYEDFIIFVHLEPLGGGKPLAQDDSPPRFGLYPTSAWAVGQPFVDPRYVPHGGDVIFPLNNVVPPGTYQLSVGLYRPKDGSRLPVDSGGDSLILQTRIIVQ